jgi:hypothetical protein
VAEGRINENQFYLVVMDSATFDVDINLGYLKKTDTFLNQNANLMVSFEIWHYEPRLSQQNEHFLFQRFLAKHMNPR